ncbi:Cdc25 phosphatase Ibp1 [Saxophila tyrrhenica]|uniref:Cdc25 phosphatase Ibp1 n=1 Tax=Saxophila tyrrhenica TaxID=1690608 RepID=A0AAV9NW74_9PEZI|nr:Cdc25 phosphatase Ibp1 [Saxophila tyrrhenica]
MYSYTFSDLSWITREDLAESVRSGKPGVTVIDVRDSDYIGGHIKGCMNVPTNTHDYRMPELIRTLRDQDKIVFHCSLSQQRGPGSALRYLRERDRMAEKGEIQQRRDGKDVKSAQEVVVLDGGFSKWQQKFGEDQEVTEGYAKDLWE